MEQFNFLPQSHSIESLLKACKSALPYVPEPEKGALVQAMREFETFGGPTLWSAADVEAQEEMPLTAGERREALCRFLQNYERKESDWMLDMHARSVLTERYLHIRVEYDESYTGGDYSGTGKYAYLPLPLVDGFVAEAQGTDDGVALAFSAVTKLDSMHIIHYTLDERYNQDGELVPAGKDGEVPEDFVDPNF